MRRRKRVAISQLAAFADNPAAFRQRNGGVESMSAVRYGNRYHRNLGRSRFRAWHVVVLGILLLAATVALGLVSV